MDQRRSDVSSVSFPFCTEYQLGQLGRWMLAHADFKSTLICSLRMEQRL